jgi:hypothetical protein
MSYGTGRLARPLPENAARSKIKMPKRAAHALTSQPQPPPDPNSACTKILALSSWSIYVEFSVVIQSENRFVICRVTLFPALGVVPVAMAMRFCGRFTECRFAGGLLHAILLAGQNDWLLVHMSVFRVAIRLLERSEVCYKD